MTARPNRGKDTGKRKGHQARKKRKLQRTAKYHRNSLEKNRRASRAAARNPQRHDWRERASVDPLDIS